MFISFIIGSLIGRISKKVSYFFGIIGSVLGIVLALLVLLTGSSLEFDLWKTTQTSSFEFFVSPFNSYFLLISCFVWLGTCVYSIGYDDEDYTNDLSSLLIFTILSMVVTILSGDSISFLVGWESMTIASFFMILKGKGNADTIRKAAFLFLAFGEVSTVFIMLSFSGIFSSIGNFNFLASSSSAIHASGPLSSWILVTALIGFGLKMGIAPFHMSEWLPIAHSNAPSNASALLSSTLTLMGVYGFINVVVHLGQYELWWGWITLVMGGISALLGSLFASVSEHTKGLPAYSTIENNGLIFVAVGTFILASYYHLTLLGDFALIAALYHAFSHSISKASLFLVMGWISKIKKSFDLNNQNPISKTVRQVGYFPGLFTILSLSAVPPLAGFVSEWMILETLFQSFRFGDIASQIIGTIVGAITALAAGIIIIAMTKAYGFGIIWPEMKDDLETKETKSKIERSKSIKGIFYYFLFLILGIGVAAPVIFLLASNSLSQILHTKVFDSLVTGLLGIPTYFVILSGKPFGGFSPTFTAVFMVCLMIVPVAISRLGDKWRIRRTFGWFGGQTQPSATSSELYNSFSYSTPLRIMLKFLFKTKEKIVEIGGVRRPIILSPEEYFVEVEVLDVFKQIYDTLTKYALSLSFYTAMTVMPGRLGLYLIYIMTAFIFVILYISLIK